jgi:hypothetical protein
MLSALSVGARPVAVPRLARSARVLVVAGVVFAIAYANGGYSLSARSIVALSAWWAVLLSIVFAIWPIRPIPRAAFVVGGLLGAFALWTFVSMAWSPSNEATFNEFNRVSLYLAAFVVVVCAGTHSSVRTWLDALAVATAAVAAVALVSRCFPDVFPDRGFATFLPGQSTRLSFPLGYWNGLGTFVALGLPVLLRVGATARRTAAAAAAIAAMPLIVSVIFLTSSRGGFAVAIVAALAAVALSPNRWRTLASAAVGVSGAAVTVVVIASRDEFTNSAVPTALVREQGRSVALYVALVCALCAGVVAAGRRLLAGTPYPPRWVGRAALGVALAAATVVVVALHPIQRFETFKEPPHVARLASGDFVKAHLLSGNGSGRWQFWGAALDQWRTWPIGGEGAGTFESWWAQHGSFYYFLRDAHSLYVEVLGELGIVGFVLLVGAVLTPFVVGGRRYHRTRDLDERVTLSTLLAVFAGWAVSLAIDWMWEMTIVSLVGIVCAAFICGSATDGSGADPRPRDTRRSSSVSIAVVAVAWLLLWAQAIPLLTQIEIRASQRAASRNDLLNAYEAARKARNLQPWVASPYLQLALVAERGGALAPARRWIDQAVAREPRDWRLWLVSARLNLAAGRTEAAKRSLAQARRLNPRSPLFGSGS